MKSRAWYPGQTQLVPSFSPAFIQNVPCYGRSLCWVLNPGAQIFILRSGVLVHVLLKLHAKRGQKKLQRLQWFDCSFTQPKPTRQPQFQPQALFLQGKPVVKVTTLLSYLQTLETLTLALSKDSKVFLYTRTATNWNVSEVDTFVPVFQIECCLSHLKK